MPRLAHLLALVGLLVVLAGSASAQDSSIDLPFARRAFQELRWASADDGARRWGVELAGPTLFFDPATGAVVANQADAEGRLEPADAEAGAGLFAGRVGPDFAGANTALDWAGVHWTVVLWPLPQEHFDRMRLLLHESWHRIQEDLGLPAASVRNEHLGTRDGRMWLLLEYRALARALPAWGPERRQALEDALAFRAFRRGLFPDAARDEDRMEVHEGLAEYAGVASAGLTNSQARAFLAGRLATSALKSELSYVFAYETGPAWGLLLDMDSETWRQGLSPQSSLSGLLASANGIDPGQPTLQDVTRRARAYDGEALIAAEARRDEERRAAEAAHRRALVDGPVLRLPLANMSCTFDPNAIVPLQGVGTVYRGARFLDDWGILTVDGAVLAAGDFSAVTGPAPASAADTSGPGWTLQLAAGWRLVAGQRAGDFTVTRE